MTPKNGNKTKWIIGLILGILGLAVTALTSMNAMGVFQGEVKRDVVHNHEAIKDIQVDQAIQWEDIDSNMKHQWEDAKDTEIFLGRFDRIEEGMSEFATEQRSMNKALMDKLDEK